MIGWGLRNSSRLTFPQARSAQPTILTYRVTAIVIGVNNDTGHVVLVLQREYFGMDTSNLVRPVKEASREAEGALHEYMVS